MAVSITGAVENALGTGGTSIAAPSITPATGDFLCVFTYGDVDTTHTITDTLGLTWTEQASCLNSGIAGRSRLITAPVPSGSATTVTLTYGTAQTANRDILVLAVSGAGFVDGAAGLADTGNSPTSPKITATPTLPPGLAIAFCADIQGTTNPGTDTGDGFALFNNYWATFRNATVSTKAYAAGGAIVSNFPNSGFDHVNQLLVLFGQALTAPAITTQPNSVTVNENDSAQFTVAAVASAGSLSYQWQDNRTGSFANCADGSGATTTTYTAASSRLNQTGRQFQCVVTDSNASTTSSAATMKVFRLDDVIRPRRRRRSTGLSMGLDSREWW